MDPFSLSRLNQLRSFVATVEKANGGGDSAAAAIDTSKREEIVHSIEINQILVEPAGDSSVASTLVNAWLGSLHKLIQRHSTLELGLILFRATVSNSSHQRFLVSYSSWGSSILDAVKREGVDGFHGLGLSTMSAVFTRLASLSVSESNAVRRDGSPLASKSCSMALQLLSDPKSCASDKRFALALLRSVLLSLPASLRQQSASIEQGIVKLINNHSSSKDASSMLESAAVCLSLIPRIQGTPETWSLFARRSLTSLSESIDAILMGLGDQSLAAMGRDSLGPELPSTGSSLLGPLPCLGSGLKGSLVPAVNNLSLLLTLVENLLTVSYPVPVPVPSAAIFAMLSRLIKMDEGAVLQAGRTAPSAGLFTELCISIPLIRAGAWASISLLIHVSGLSFCPHFAPCARLVGESLRRIRARGSNSLVGSPTKERSSLYHAAAELARAGGYSVARLIADESFGATLVEVYGSCPPTDETNVHIKKKAKVEVKPEEKFSFGSISPEDLATQSAALDMIEAIVLTGGSLLDPSLRANMDTLSLHVASSSFDALQVISSDASLGQASLKASAHGALVTLTKTAFSLLLASIQIPPSAGHQALYLSEAISLFRQGLSHGPFEVKYSSLKAIASIECYLHPRSGSCASTGNVTVSTSAFVKPRLWSSHNDHLVPTPVSDSIKVHHHFATEMLNPDQAPRTSDKGHGASTILLRQPADEKEKPKSGPVLMSHKPVVQASTQEPIKQGTTLAMVHDESEDSEGPMPDIDEGDE